MLLVHWQYSLFPQSFDVVQKSGGSVSSAIVSVNHVISKINFSPCIKNGNDTFLAFKAFTALQEDLQLQRIINYYHLFLLINVVNQ